MSTTRTKLTRTGHCINNQCEGTKPKSPSGKPMPICLQWEWCKCKCHKEITAMFESLNLPRPEPEQNPDFHPDKGNFVMPDYDTSAAMLGLSMSGGTDAPPAAERPVVTPPSAVTGPLSSGPHGTVEPRFAPTASGRKAKGQLEYEVLEVCADYSRDVFDWEACTPKNISEEIGKRNAAEPPSTGAIVEVFKRWDKLGFARWDKKPIRLTHFEMDPSLPTLLMLKDQVKRARRRGESEARRGIRPPQPR